MYVTDDAHFEPVSSAPAYNNGFPSIQGVMRVVVEKSFARLVPKLLKQNPSEPSSTELLVVGRSGHAQVGIDVVVDPARRIELDGLNLTIPVIVSALGPIREPWLESIIRLARSGLAVRAGRVLIVDWSQRLGKTEVLERLDQHFIAADAGSVVNGDGSLCVPIERTEFISDSSAFGDPEVRKSILLHSRSALVRHQDTRPLGSDILPAHSLSVLGIRFSSGPCPAIIRPAVSAHVQHLRAGLYLDPYRSTRISREYGAMGLRQVELFNTTDKPAPGAGQLKITLDLFPPPKQPAYLLDSYSDARKRVFCHNHGTPLSSIIQITNETIRTAIFDTTTTAPGAGGDYAKIITPNGVTRVGWANSPKFQRALTEHGIVNPTGRRSEEASLRRAAENLVYSVDQARLYVSHALPPADELFLLKDLGVKAFLFRAFSPSRAPAASVAAPGPYMTGHLHETLHALWKSGVSLIYYPESSTREVRELHKGFWCSIPAKARYDEVTTIVNMYGSHSDALVKANQKSVQAFVAELLGAVDAKELALMHGKGRGFMGLADEVARKNDVLSIGVGIDVEFVGQTSNPSPELALDFTAQERAYRQKLMDHLGLFKIFNLGGYGTLEEAAITICSTKLLENMATPIIFVDESVEKRGAWDRKNPASDHLWQHLAEQAGIISGLTSARFPSGKPVDISTHPLGQTWVRNILHCAPSYLEAGRIITRFIADPAAYWKAAGLSPAEIAGAWRSYSRRMATYGLKPPGFLERGVGKSG